MCFPKTDFDDNGAYILGVDKTDRLDLQNAVLDGRAYIQTVERHFAFAVSDKIGVSLPSRAQPK